MSATDDEDTLRITGNQVSPSPRLRVEELRSALVNANGWLDHQWNLRTVDALIAALRSESQQEAIDMRQRALERHAMLADERYRALESTLLERQQQIEELAAHNREWCERFNRAHEVQQTLAQQIEALTKERDAAAAESALTPEDTPTEGIHDSGRP